MRKKWRRYKVRPWRAEIDLPVCAMYIVNGTPLWVEIPADRVENLIVIERLSDGMEARACLNTLRDAGPVADTDEWAGAAWRLISKLCTINEKLLRRMRLRRG